MTTPRLESPGELHTLIVDDDPDVRRVHGALLRSLGCSVAEAATGEIALSLLQAERFELMICDVWMPGLSGDEVVTQAMAMDEDLAIVMLSGDSHAVTATRALTRGAVDYLVKPVERPELKDAITRALRRRLLRREQRRVEWLIREEVELKTAELAAERSILRGLTVRIAETLIGAMEAKDVYLRGHSQRVADLSASIADEMKLHADEIEAIRLAARLHDVGKIGIREEVLNKPDVLTPAEYEHVKDHVRLGMEILAPLHHLGRVLTFVAEHHERFDGSGYPRGLHGEQITLGGRILCAADSYDAITSRRAYRGGLEPAEALEYMAGLSGTLLDPQVYLALRSVVERNRSLTFIE